MAKATQKYYVVWNGREPGIYDSWDACQEQIKGFTGAKYKSFKSRQEAELAYEESPKKHIGAGQSKKNVRTVSGSDIEWESISVDAACSGKTGQMEYRGVWSGDKSVVFRQGPFADGTNNVGEFLALVHALAYLKKNGMEDIPIYSDSRTAMSWLKNQRVKTTLKKTRSNQILFELIDRALQWIKSNTYRTRVLKWETASWGEIPADFGRK